MTTSLRTRSLLTILAVVLPVIIGYAFASHAHVSHEIGRRLDGRLGHEMNMLKEAIARSAGDDAQLRAIVDLMPLDIFPERRQFGIWIEGHTVLATQRLPFASVPTRSAGYSDLDQDGMQWRLLIAEMPAAAETNHRRIKLAIAEPTYARDALIREGAIDSTVPIFIVIPLLAAGIYVALLSSLRPLTRLSEQISKRSADRLQPITVDGAPSEAVPIIESVNALMMRVAGSIDRERRFTADAAHELRTPLTALKAHAQVALRAQDESLRRETLGHIVRVVNRTDRMISQLLVLARLDPQVNEMEVSEVDLAGIASQTLNDLQSSAASRRQELNLHCESDTMVLGNPGALTILARNLIENAIHYSADEAPIEIRVFREGAYGVLEVSDLGPGIADAVKESVFERFRRLPDTRAPGTGLGLSIVQRIAELHHAHVSLHDQPSGQGLRVTARIPIVT